MTDPTPTPEDAEEVVAMRARITDLEAELSSAVTNLTRAIEKRDARIELLEAELVNSIRIVGERQSTPRKLDPDD